MALGTASKKIGKKMTQGAGKALSKVYTKDAKRGATLANMYTGKKLRETAVLGTVAAVGIGAAGGLDNIFGEKRAAVNMADELSIFNVGKHMSAKVGNAPIEKVESPMMQADGLIQEDKTLGANGAMVFGMHNKRRGG